GRSRRHAGRRPRYRWRRTTRCRSFLDSDACCDPTRERCVESWFQNDVTSMTSAFMATRTHLGAHARSTQRRGMRSAATTAPRSTDPELTRTERGLGAVGDTELAEDARHV